MGIWNKIFGSKSKVPNREQPEDHYEIEVSNEYVIVTHPKRKVEQINWDEIEELIC